jgi:hypothetical protein
MAEQNERTCIECKFCMQQDYGYSNYTVEGTNARCLFGLVGEFDTGEERQVEAAKQVCQGCPHFSQGTGLYFDCDGDDINQSIADWIKQYVNR